MRAVHPTVLDTDVASLLGEGFDCPALDTLFLAPGWIPRQHRAMGRADFASTRGSGGKQRANRASFESVKRVTCGPSVSACPSAAICSA
jgi:hypothetical protein